MRVETRQRASRYISRNVAARPGGRQSHPPKLLQNVRQRFDRHPMQLHVLPHGDIRNAASVALSEVGERARLMTAQEAVGNSDANSDDRVRLAFAIVPADHAGAVALRVDAPGTKIRTQPFRWNRSVTLPRKPPDLIEMLPGILLPFQSLDALRFAFLDFAHLPPWNSAQKTKNPRSPELWQRGLRNFCLLCV